MGDVRFFGILDETGLPLGFYPSDIWPDDSRPADCIELSLDQYSALLDNYGARLVAGEVVYPPPAPPLTPEQQLALLPPVSRVQMLAALVDFEIITEAEAVGWLGGDLPAVVQAAIDSLPEGARLVATLRAKAQTPVDPSDPLVAALAASKDMGIEALILLFGHAAGL